MTYGALASNITLDDHVDDEIAAYLDLQHPKSFFLFAGAGSGKTSSLVKALNHVRQRHGRDLILRGQRVGVITYTNAACDEITRRVDFHPLFYVSTIHSFAWDLIQGFHHDIREWLRVDLAKDILRLNQEEAKGRAGTKASITRQTQIASKTKRLERLDLIKSFSYSPNGDHHGSNSLNHSEVIDICSCFIAEKPLMGWILTGRFPFLLIDESQDTNKNLVDAFFIAAKVHEERFALGLIGDVMQRIYSDGKQRIESELPPTWGKPSKKLNHRCPKRVVRLINKLREPVDTHLQDPRSDAVEGHVRLFIRPIVSTGQQEIEDAARFQMSDLTKDERWRDRTDCKILTLEHHMAAKRLGFDTLFAPLYEVDTWRTGLLNGTLPSIRFFTQVVLPLVKAQQSGDRFAVARIMRSSSPLITPDALKEAQDPGELLRKAQLGVNALMKLWDQGEPTCEAVLHCVGKYRLFELPDTLKPIWELLQQREDDSESHADKQDAVSTQIAGLLGALKAPFKEVDLYRQYVAGEASFDTHQGVKGLEFERVMVIVSDEEARGFMFGYGKLMGETAETTADIKNQGEGRDSTIDRTRRLFYVTCSRAEKSLAVVVYAANPTAVGKYVVDNGWFEKDEIDIR